jgi:uncharacterized protein
MISATSLHARLVACAIACASISGAALAQVAVSVERISFRVADAFEKGTGVTGELRIPASTRERLPAVVIVDSTPGFDGRGAFHAEALNQAGIATLEVDPFEGKGDPATPRHNLPHMYQSLQWLAGHPRVDPARIGIMGFSSGGILSLLTSSETLAGQYAGGDRRFAAHLGFYPHCWFQRDVLAGRSPSLEPATYQRVTGRPVHILAGARDDYDGPDGCDKLLAELPADARRHFSLTVYPDATFAWDSRFSSRTYEPNAHHKKGGMVEVVADAAIANQSREFAVAWFRKLLAAD